MSEKNLVYSEIEVQGPGGKPVKTWMLLPFGDSPLLQAMWSPPLQVLVCQWNSIKKNLVDVPKMNSKGNRSGTEQRQLDQYFMMNISDTKAIQAILDNFVVNYDGQDWKLEFEDPRSETLSTPAEELEKV